MDENFSQDLLDLLDFALKEYGSSTLYKKELMENDHIQQTFGCLVADISMVPTDKNRLYLRRYDIKAVNNNDWSLSFILGHASMLFGMSSRKFREELLIKETIKGVITLKQSLFKQIVIPAALIILGKKENDTWFTSVENIENLLLLLEDKVETVKSLYYSSNIDAENMLPEHYNSENALAETIFEGSQTKKLEDIAEIINGKGAKKENYLENGIPYLRARDIQNGKIIKPDVYIDFEEANYFSNQLIQAGDILLTKFFGQNKLALVTESDVPAIASNALFIIRPFDISEGYLYKYLTSKTGNDIFNKQLNKVKKGVTIPSVTLSDLKKIEVPIFEEDIMQNLDQVEYISDKDAVITAKKLMRQSAENASNLESSVKNAFIKFGWNESGFTTKQEFFISLEGNKRWTPDFLYEMPDGRKVIIEVKSNIAFIRSDWIQAVKHILSEENDYIFILTTGVYYETHISGVSQSLKMTQPPTIEEILRWAKEVH